MRNMHENPEYFTREKEESNELDLGYLKV